MRVLLQRVSEATVSVNDDVIGSVKAGFVLLVGFGKEDTDAVIEPMVRKVVNLRVFEDEQGRMQHSLIDEGYGVLAVPQFTLYGRTAKGRRPDFTTALEPARASQLFDDFVLELGSAGVQHVDAGEFGAHMSVALVNDGPVTLMLEQSTS